MAYFYRYHAKIWQINNTDYAYKVVGVYLLPLSATASLSDELHSSRQMNWCFSHCFSETHSTKGRKPKSVPTFSFPRFSLNEEKKRDLSHWTAAGFIHDARTRTLSDLNPAVIMWHHHYHYEVTDAIIWPTLLREEQCYEQTCPDFIVDQWPYRIWFVLPFLWYHLLSARFTVYYVAVVVRSKVWHLLNERFQIRHLFTECVSKRNIPTAFSGLSRFMASNTVHNSD